MPFPKVLWIPIVLATASLITRLLGLDWGAIPTDLLVAILIASVLVGFAEETLFAYDPNAPLLDEAPATS